MPKPARSFCSLADGVPARAARVSRESEATGKAANATAPDLDRMLAAGEMLLTTRFFVLQRAPRVPVGERSPGRSTESRPPEFLRQLLVV